MFTDQVFQEVWFESYYALLGQLVANYGTVNTPVGLKQNLSIIKDKLLKLGFRTEHISKSGKSEILIANREPVGTDTWIGLYGHYDVEPLEEGWHTDPLSLTTLNERLYGRGTGDNLGPLALRLTALEYRPADLATPGMYWLLQGEEEIGSPFAHEVFPELTTPEVTFWLEETGYFNKAGAQRFLVMHSNGNLESLVDSLGAMAIENGREIYQENRFLNKAFGQHRCPYLNHIVKESPYLGIGPNDDFTGVHAPNESLPLNTLLLSLGQFNHLLDEVAKWSV